MNIDAVQQDRYVGQLKSFRDRLLDATSRNPSICVRKATKKSSFDLHALDAVSFETIFKSPGEASEVVVVPESLTAPAATQSRSALTLLARNAAARAEESGLRDLYIGFCWLEGFISAETFVRAPLVMIPATLMLRRKERKSGWVLGTQDGPVRVNRSLLVALRRQRSFSVDVEKLEETINLTLADGHDEATAYLKVVTLFRDLGLTAESTLFVGAQPLVALKKESIQEFKTQPLAFRSLLAVGMFPQTSTALYTDIEQMLQRALQGETDQGIVDNLLEAPADDAEANTANFADIALDAVPDTMLNLVVASDPSQDAVVVRAKDADCVVVRGPPGTGKSQVIVNLVADAMSRGGRVLVVCQKRAALDVVYARLRDVGLGDFAFLIHDEGMDRPALYQQIARVLAMTARDQQLQPLEQLSAAIDVDIQAVRSIVEPLRMQWHGIQLSALYRRARTRFVQRLELARLPADEAALTHLVAELSEHQRAFLTFDDPSSPVALRSDWSKLGHADRQHLQRDLEAFVAHTAAPTGLVKRLNGPERNAIASSLTVYESLISKWFRWLIPAWWKVRREVADVLTRHTDVALGQWPQTLSTSADRAQHLEKIGAWMRPSWREAAGARFENSGSLQAMARELQDFVVRHFDEIQAHDERRVALGADLEIVSQCMRCLSRDDDWADEVVQSVTLQWIDEAERKHTVLKGNPLERYEGLRGQLRRRLDLKRGAVAVDVAAALQRSAAAPAAGTLGASVRQQYTKLSHEVLKKRRLKPLRALINEFPVAMQRSTPCWLASPEVVAEIFPLQKDLFDLVIFDEASQLAVERSLPVLYRAKHVVVAGDEQQMPPSNFFGAANDDDDEDGDEEVPEALKQESLLVLAKRIYGFCYLGWHYRSENKELIDFSNFAFYDGALNIAANVGRSTQSAPIKWVPVDGVWQGNTNAVEMRKAVDILHETLAAPADGRPRSVGIITFNAVQMDAIKDEIERRRGADSAFATLMLAAETRPSIDERPFVKNIENVQGDERDVIIFSVGYGPDPSGTFRRSFGPIGLAGGENRLNVAVTRAKREAHVICSFDPELLVGGTSKNLGPVRFRQYLQYAKAISDGVPAAIEKILLEINPSVAVGAVARKAAVESDFEAQVVAALQAEGYDVETQVGLAGYRIDLAVVDPRDAAKFCLGIECDGANFHSGKSVRERDIARQRFLESRGWAIARLWSRNWWLDPEREIRRIVALLPSPRPRTAIGQLTVAAVAETDDPFAGFEEAASKAAIAPVAPRSDIAVQTAPAELAPHESAIQRVVEVAPTPTVFDPNAWLSTLPTDSVREVFEHLVAYGAITEPEAIVMLKSPREMRRFALEFDSYAALAPFWVRIEVIGGIKRYVREGPRVS